MSQKFAYYGFIVGFLLIFLLPVTHCDELSSLSGVLSKIGEFEANKQKQANSVLGIVNVQWQCLADCGVQFANSMNSFSNSVVKQPLQLHGNINSLIQQTASLSPAERRDTFERVCSVQTSYVGCLKSCPNDLVRQSIEAGMSSIDLICGEKHDEYVASIPCLVEKDLEIRMRCKEQSDQLSLATLRYQNPSILKSPEKVLQAMRDFCLASLNQSNCAIPAVKDLCGDSSAELFDTVLQRSLKTTRQLMAKTGINLPSECQLALGGKPNLISPDNNQNTLSTTTSPSPVLVAPPTTHSFRHNTDSAQSVKHDSMHFRSSSAAHYVCKYLIICILVNIFMLTV